MRDLYWANFNRLKEYTVWFYMLYFTRDIGVLQCGNAVLPVLLLMAQNFADKILHCTEENSYYLKNYFLTCGSWFFNNDYIFLLGILTALSIKSYFSAFVIMVAITWCEIDDTNPASCNLGWCVLKISCSQNENVRLSWKRALLSNSLNDIWHASFHCQERKFLATSSSCQ